jgi:hypothetical protein
MNREGQRRKEVNGIKRQREPGGNATERLAQEIFHCAAVTREIIYQRREMKMRIQSFKTVWFMLFCIMLMAIAPVSHGGG